jgi:WD40 repeat protein
LTTWFVLTDSSEATIVSNDQVITYLAGLLFLNKEGDEIQTIIADEKNTNCNEGSASHMTDIPGTDLIVTGHWHYGDITASYGSSRLLVWEKKLKSCKELLKEFTGGLSSLSASYDGGYISYSVITSTVDTVSGELIAGSTTHIYGLNEKKEICHLVGYESEFNRKNQLAVYDIKKGVVNLVTPSDCTTQMSFVVGSELRVIEFHPSGDILAGSSGKTVEFWDVNSGEKIEEVNINDSEINLPYLGFSSDGRFLVVTKDKSSSTESQVMLWGIPGN